MMSDKATVGYMLGCGFRGATCRSKGAVEIFQGWTLHPEAVHDVGSRVSDYCMVARQI